MLIAKDYIEIISDICGATGGFVLLVPSCNILSLRHKLYTAREAMVLKLSSANKPTNETLEKILDDMDKVVNAYRPKDTKIIIVGIALFTASFLLKLLFHGITKF